LSGGRSLGSGGSSPAGSITKVAVVVLVVLVLVLCAGVFLLYDREKGVSNDAKVAKDSYGTLNNSYNDLSGKYTALVANNAELNERYIELNDKYDNVSSRYSALKNQSDTATVKLGEFLESDPTVAYNYRILANYSSPVNVTTMDVVVNLYNVGQSDANNVVVSCTIQSRATNQTSKLTSPQPIALPSLSKTQYTFHDLDNTTLVQSVYVTVS
jgi:hypothetical protein